MAIRFLRLQLEETAVDGNLSSQWRQCRIDRSVEQEQTWFISTIVQGMQ